MMIQIQVLLPQPSNKPLNKQPKLLLQPLLQKHNTNTAMIISHQKLLSKHLRSSMILPPIYKILNK